MLDHDFIEESLTKALIDLEQHISINNDAYKKTIEAGLFELLTDISSIENIAYVNISYLYSNIVNNRKELMVTAYDEDWYVGERLYKKEIYFGDFFSILSSLEVVWLKEIRKSLGHVNENHIQQISLECIRVIGKLAEQLFRSVIRTSNFHQIQFTLNFGEYLDHSKALYIHKESTVTVKDLKYSFDRGEACKAMSFKDLVFNDQAISAIDFSESWFHTVAFESCHLEDLFLFNVTFNQCIFTNVTFKACTLLATFFHNCHFIDCHFEDINSKVILPFNAQGSALYDKTAFVNCKFQGMDTRLIAYLGA